MKQNRHIVDFEKWCATCKFKDCSEWDYDQPCHECIDEPINYDSTKPTLWEEEE